MIYYGFLYEVYIIISQFLLNYSVSTLSEKSNPILCFGAGVRPRYGFRSRKPNNIDETLLQKGNE